ncbi:MAG TPA: carbohydrate ABC transporter permease [Spirochaetes bacterium]|nr:carbohydrate ABC transporter permease [Spirochaetota bacterium]
MITAHGIGKRKPLGVTIILIFLIIFMVWTMFPILWALITSFKQPGDSFKATFIPYKQFKPTLYAWKDAFVTTRDRTLRSLRNSIVISTLSSAVVLLLGAFAGYSLARYEFKKWKNKDIALWILSQRMFPPVAVLIPYFLIMQRLHLLDNILGVVMVHVTMNLPLAVWLMLDFFADMPRDIEEAAMIDGCGHFKAFFYIAIPIAAPGLVAVYVLSFIFSWNEFLFVVVFGYQRAMTLPVMIAGSLSVRGLDFWKVASLSILAVIPPVVLAVVLSRYLVRGLTMGAIKE